MSEKRHGRKRPNTKGHSQEGGNSSNVAPIAGKRSMTDVAVFFLLFVATIGLAFVGIFYGGHKVTAIWIMFGCIVSYGLAGCLFWQQKVSPSPDVSENAIKFTIGGTIALSGVGVPELLILHGSDIGDVLTPVPILLSATITNALGHPVTLDVLSASVRRSWWQWEKLRNIPASGGQVYLTRGVRSEAAERLTFDALDEVLKSKAIGSHASVTGVMLLDAPDWLAELPLDEKRNIKVRFDVRDVEGNKFRSDPVDLFRDETGNLTASGQRILFSRDTKDLTPYRVVPLH